MKTKLIDCTKDICLTEKLSEAGKILRDGGLVVFPTETVYGLGANALDADAANKIYTAKGRPSDNPLIVHIYSEEQLYEIVKSVSEAAEKAIKAFWPGPLTLIMEKSQTVPDAVTAGLATVAIRMPEHKVALELLKSAGVPIAAPSANISGKPSPTIAAHVIQDMNGKVAAIIDGGACQVGLESTILDTTVDPPVILRPGGITLEMLRDVLGDVELDSGLLEKPEADFKPRAPGMKYTHYSPDANVTIVEGKTEEVVAFINTKLEECKKNNIKAGVLATEETRAFYGDDFVITVGTRKDLATIAEKLFESLREFDAHGIKEVYAEAFENSGIGLAIMNRMNKAAGYNIKKV